MLLPQSSLQSWAKYAGKEISSLLPWTLRLNRSRKKEGIKKERKKKERKKEVPLNAILKTFSSLAQMKMKKRTSRKTLSSIRFEKMLVEERHFKTVGKFRGLRLSRLYRNLCVERKKETEGLNTFTMGRGRKKEKRPP